MRGRGLAAPERKYALPLSAVGLNGRFCGYASLFGRMDLSGDIVVEGAFSRTLSMKGAGGIGMLYEHDPKLPIGAWITVEEDRRGLWVEGAMGCSRAADRATAMMQAGTMSGLSIGFRTVGSETDRRAGVRRLTEIDLWEVSVVASPMLPEARARAVGTERVDAEGEASNPAVDAGLLARLRRSTAILRETR